MKLLNTQLHHAELMLQQRLRQLEQKIREGDDTMWPEYAQIAQALATVETKTQQQPEYLSTREMAARLGVSTKTLLRRKQRGQLAPALQVGKLIRWRAAEAPNALSNNRGPTVAPGQPPTTQITRSLK